MRLITAMICLFLPYALPGCANQTTDCAMGVGRNGCNPGTNAYEEMKSQQELADTKAEIDDARCQAYGARGTAAYLDCRSKLVNDSTIPAVHR
jgi:hypothetical protein